MTTPRRHPGLQGLLVVALLPLLLARCQCADPPAGDGDPPLGCVLDSDCGDGQACVANVCTVVTGEGEGDPGEGEGEGGVGEGEGEEDRGVLVALLPAPLVEFGAVRPGEVVERAITLKNTGAVPLRILQILIDDEAPQSTFTADPVGFLDLEVPAQGEVGVFLTHTPNDGTPDSADLEIVHTGAGGLLKIDLAAEFKGTPALSVTRDPGQLLPDLTSLGFGQTPQNAQQEVVLFVRNRGGSDSVMTLRDAVMTPVDGPFSVEILTPGAVLPAFDAFCGGLQDCRAGASACTAGICRDGDDRPLDSAVVVVRFAPLVAGAAAATLTLGLDGPGSGIRRDIALSGLGTSGNLLVSPAVVDVDPAYVGRAAAQQIVIENVGASNETLDGLALASGAAWELQHALVFPLVLVPGGQALATVSIDAAGPGTFDDFLTVDAAAGDDVTVPLHAVGREAPAIVVDDAVAFGFVYTGGALVKPLSIRNRGPGVLNVESLSISGPGASQFALTLPGSLPTTIDPLVDVDDTAPNLIASITYNAGAPSPSVDRATLRITTDDPDAPFFDVALSGQSVEPVIALSTRTLDFGTIDVSTEATLPLTVRNTGSGPLIVTAVAVSPGAFSVAASVPLPTTLAFGQSLTLDVTFDAALPGNATATLTLANNDGLDPTAPVALLGRGRTCDPVFGTTVVQNGDTCTYSCAAGFIDLDADLNTSSSDGCEYECVVIPGVDRPEANAPFLDQDCDGIDGSADDALFVSPTGNDSNTGTRDAPMRSVDIAYAQAALAGLDVYVAGGSYTLPGSLVLQNGTSLFGGYESIAWQRSDAEIAVLQVAKATAVRAANLTATTVLDRVDVVGGDASAGATAYALLVTDSTNLEVRASTLRAGRGGNGSAGASPPGQAVAGGNGGLGDGGCEESGGLCGGCSEPRGGGGGVNPVCGRNGGNGGPPTRGDNPFGQSGSAGAGGTAAGLGAPGRVGDSDPPGNSFGGTAGPAAPGSDGSAGAPLFLADGYQPSPGQDGGAGPDGNGGGGGGGGGGGTTSCDSYGAGGGGGGAGGCGGALATAATSAGGSFALYAFGSTVSVADTTLVTSGGGAGGVGGTGQAGGAGGRGARRGDGGAPNAGNLYGGSGEQDDGGNGGRGGDGGAGGRGGHGGSGAGGPSIGIFAGGNSQVAQTNNAFSLGGAGAGGDGPGNDGPPGERANTRIQ